MGKQSLSIKGTSVSDGKAIGNQIEQTLSVDDNVLPSPQELAAYKEIDPKIVDFLINASEREQIHRHKSDEKKLKILNYNEHKILYINWWGMFFAFLCIAFSFALTGYALYTNRIWFAGIFGFTSIASIASIFIKNKKD